MRQYEHKSLQKCALPYECFTITVHACTCTYTYGIPISEEYIPVFLVNFFIACDAR